ncbi:MAG: ATP-dependent DNA ligase [Planctomycetes bacterium]|nr:ATP-dependent DNA ligase [Planctomycetota bacterium]
MLARIGEPFDSDEHLFELKWDGVRAVSYVEHGSLRMHGRRRRDLATRYPELAFLAELPSGCVVDGELVVLRDDGRPDFRAILSRENASARSVDAAMRRHPVVYVAFDLLYERGQPLLREPLRARRERLQALVAAAGAPRLMLSDGVVGQGLSLFEAARSQELEGIVAKRLDAPYLPGERGDAWQKIKPVKSIHCLVLGYEPDAARRDDFKSLIVATDIDGELRCVGKVGSGIDEATRRELRELLRAKPAEAPLIDAGVQGVWVQPGIYCMVSYLERTRSGNLRAPVFKGLVSGGAA